MITIEFEGEIVAKGRPRVTKRGTFTPKKTRDFEKYVRLVTKTNVKEPILGGVAVDIMVMKMPPISWSKKKRRDAIVGEIIPTTRPDVDNYAKSILDGMSGVAFEDDSSILDLRVKKKYAEKDGAVVMVKKIDGETPY